MHEWAFAEGIVKSVLDESKNNGFQRLNRVVIVMGELQGIDREIVSFALENLKKGTILENTKFEFEVEEVEFKCRNCKHTWKLDDTEEAEDEMIRESIHFLPETAHTFLKCPECGSKDFDIIKGRGVYISRIDGEV